MNGPFRLLPAAFAGLVISAAFTHDASAGEALTPIAPPAARLGASDSCRFVAPRFEPRTHGAKAQATHFLGGAKLTRPVAAPCPHGAAEFDV